jgi:ribosome-binding ATPase YchF (GTP1/OBG family)
MDAKTKSEMTEADILALGGIKETGISQVIRESRDYLGFQCYYTAGPKETASWRMTTLNNLFSLF